MTKWNCTVKTESLFLHLYTKSFKCVFKCVFILYLLCKDEVLKGQRAEHWLGTEDVIISPCFLTAS